MSADQLANVFLREYYSGKEISYPINPFQMLTDLKIAFLLRPFKKYEGIYIPAEDEEDFPIVGINLLRPIVRQRFTAAHELCHHLKDVHSSFMCATNAKSEIEKYAENFASELLMPTAELRKQAQKYAKGGYVDLDGVLLIADYFGVPTNIPNLSISALPFRAYALIINDWFRDQNLSNPLNIPVNDTTIQGVNTGTFVTDVVKLVCLEQLNVAHI